jgi:hypothetical protein
MNYAAGFLLSARNRKSAERRERARSKGFTTQDTKHGVLGIGLDGNNGASIVCKLRELCVLVVNCRPQCPLIPFTSSLPTSISTIHD